jgi:hypothetical protein
LIQSDAQEQMQTTIKEAIPSIYETAADEMKVKFADDMAIENQQIKENFLASVNGELPAVQAVLKQNIQQLLAVEMSTLESDLRQQLTTEIRDLLQSVKFVLPKS